MMKLSRFDVLALVVACAALVVVLFDFAGEVRARSGMAPDDLRLQQLTAKANRLARELEIAKNELDKRATALESLRANGPSADDGAQAALQELADRLDRIERLALAGRDASEVPPTEADVAAERARIVDSAVAHDAAARFQGVFLDAEQSLDARVSALRMLRMFPEEMAVHDDRVIDEAIRLLETADEGRLRERVVKELAHVRDDRLLDMWTHLLRVESDEGLRSEAAESLVTFLGRGEARAALEEAYANDPSERVRLDAGLALRSFDDDDPADTRQDTSDPDPAQR